jgi:hypothetical protein
MITRIKHRSPPQGFALLVVILVHAALGKSRRSMPRFTGIVNDRVDAVHKLRGFARSAGASAGHHAFIGCGGQCQSGQFVRRSSDMARLHADRSFTDV